MATDIWLYDRENGDVEMAPIGRQNPFPVYQAPPPADMTPAWIGASSGNVAAGAATATLTAGGRTVYVTGFEVTASGATTGLAVSVTLTGLIGGTRTYAFVFPAGVLVQATPLVVQFPTPVPAATPNTNVVLTLPSGGSGNTNAAVNITGYLL